MPVKQSLTEITADIVAAHVSNNSVAVNDLGNLIQRVHEALSSLADGGEPTQQEKAPAVSARASVKPDYLVCMECGQRKKTIRRHLQTAHGLTPEEYRGAYNLPASYPMSAPNYSQQRREMAQKIGLGRKPGKKRNSRQTTKSKGGNGTH